MRHSTHLSMPKAILLMLTVLLSVAEAHTECPAGYSCDGTGNAVAKCTAGEYSLTGETTCQTCPEGKQCPTVFNIPITCALGTYS